MEWGSILYTYTPLTFFFITINFYTIDYNKMYPFEEKTEAQKSQDKVTSMCIMLRNSFLSGKDPW